MQLGQILSEDHANMPKSASRLQVLSTRVNNTCDVPTIEPQALDESTHLAASLRGTFISRHKLERARACLG